MTIFGIGAAASDMLQFGSRAANAPLQTFDVPTIQGLSTWTGGIRGSLLANSNGVMIPVEQDRNAIDYVTTYQLAYLFQEGIAEYNSDTTYFMNSIVKQSGSTILYKSIADNNIGNLLSNNTNWQILGDLDNLAGNNTDGSGSIDINPNEIYQATSNGILTIAWTFYIHDTTGDSGMRVASDSNPVPTTTIFYWNDHFQSGDILGGNRQVNVQVYKGNYFEVLPTGYASSASAIFTPANF
jgi:hypothetical protein